MAPNVKRYMEPLLCITAVLCLTPRYNFEKRGLEQSRTQKFAACVIAGLQLVIFAYNLRGKTQTFYNLFQTTVVVLDIVYCASLTMITLLSITEMNFWKRGKLVDILGLLGEIDGVLAACKARFPREQTLHSTVIYYAIYFVLYVAYDAFVWITLIGMSHYQYYVMLNVQRVYLRGSVVLMHSIITAIGHRYECINAVLRRKDICGETKMALDAYNKTTEAVDIFNRLFGWQLLLLNIFLMAELLFPMNTIITLRSAGSFTDVEQFVPISLQCLLWIFSALFIATKLSAACCAVARQADKTSSASYNLLLRLEAEPRRQKTRALRRLAEAEPPGDAHRREASEDLLLLAQAASSRAVAFSAAGFFNVDYTMLFTLVTTILTYLIVLLQFNTSAGAGLISKELNN